MPKTYDIYRSVDDGDFALHATGVSLEEYTDTDVVEGPVYRYKVERVQNHLKSGRSVEITATAHPVRSVSGALENAGQTAAGTLIAPRILSGAVVNGEQSIGGAVIATYGATGGGQTAAGTAEVLVQVEGGVTNDGQEALGQVNVAVSLSGDLTNGGQTASGTIGSGAPEQPGYTNVVGHWEANYLKDTVGIADGGNVTSWADLAGNGNAMTGAAGDAVLNYNQVNGLPVVTVAHGGTGGGFGDLTLHATQTDYALLWVGNVSSLTTGSNFIWLELAGSNHYVRWLNTTSQFQYYAGNTLTNLGGATLFNDVALWKFERIGSTGTLYKNGVQVATGTIGTNTNTRLNKTNSNITMRSAELVLLSSTSVSEAWEEWLAYRYAL